MVLWLLLFLFFPTAASSGRPRGDITPASDKRKEEWRGLDCGAELKATVGGDGGDSGGGDGGIDGPSRHVLVRYVF